jgi:hypothetical protein
VVVKYLWFTELVTKCIVVFISGEVFCENSSDANCIFERPAILLEDEVQYSVLLEKLVQYISAPLLYF